VTHPRTGLADLVDQAVLLAVNCYLDKVEYIARGGALVPNLCSRCAEEHGRAACEGLAVGLFVRVTNEEYVPRVGILQHDRHNLMAGPADLSDLVEIELDCESFFERVHFGHGLQRIGLALQRVRRFAQMRDELARLDAVALAAAVRRGDVTPAEVLESTIRRLDSINGAINAVIHRHDAAARAEVSAGLPHGPFTGVPMLMKDLCACEAGRPHHRGVQVLKDLGALAARDSHLVESYRAAGFVSLGRTNTPELGAGATTEPLAYGPSRNPWNLDHGTGGSSGGAAAAVAAGVLPAANASDGGGSIRIPAAMCGLVGLKPSRGRMSMGPQLDEWGNSVQHVVSHTVRDTAAILDATTGAHTGDGVIAPPPRAPYRVLARQEVASLRIGFLDHAIRSNTKVDPEVADAVRSAARRLESLGHTVEASVPAPLLEEARVSAWSPAFAASTAASIASIEKEIGRRISDGDVEPWTRFIADRAASFNPAAVIEAQREMMSFRRDTAQWWADGFDILLTPTCLRPAPRLGEMAPDSDDLVAVQNTTLHYSQLTQPFNITGQPAISLPLSRSSQGLPIGMQFVAAYGREDLLLQLATQLESEYRWADRRSPLHP